MHPRWNRNSPAQTMTEHARNVASCFSASTLKRLLSGEVPESFESALQTVRHPTGCLGNLLVSAAFDRLYAYLRRHYRTEYVYKNAIATKLVLGRHTLARSVLLREVIVDRSVADVVLINGTSTAYEIKTELDSYARLPSQLKSYHKAFDQICIVTHPDMAGAVLRTVDNTVGVLTLSSRYTLQTIRKPVSNMASVEPAVVFDLLRKDEYISIIKDAFGLVPDVGNTLIYAACKELFVTLSPTRAHRYMTLALRARRASPRQRTFVDSAPHSLKLLAVTTRFSQAEKSAIAATLQTPVSELLNR